MFGIIQNGNLIKSELQIEGYKPIEYQPIPVDFNQATQYAVQTEPIDQGDKIFIGVEVHDLPLENVNDDLLN